jgi:hypothetical protein
MRVVHRPEFPGERLLSAEFSWKNAPTDSPIFNGRVVATDENGNQFDPIANSGVGLVDNTARRFWTREAPVFPRRGKEVRLRVMSNGNGTDKLLAEFKIPNPAPGPYPIWTPSPLPASSSKDGLEATLAKFAAIQTSPEISAKHERYSRTECDFTFRENDRQTVDWTPVVFEVSDATGNHWRAWPCNPVGGTDPGHVRAAFDGALWPGESAWKLRVEFKRTANFPASELLRIPKIRLPDTNEVLEPHTPYERNGVNIELAAVVGADVPQDNRRPALVNVRRTRGCMSVVLRGPVISLGRRMTFVSATDEQGRDVKLVGQDGPGTAEAEGYPVPFSFVFRPPQGSQELNLVVAISQGRILEFLAKPEQVTEAGEAVR